MTYRQLIGANELSESGCSQQRLDDSMAGEWGHSIAGHMHGQSVIIGAQGVRREGLRGQRLAGAEHPHTITVYQCPAIQGGDGADRAVDVAPGQA